MEATTRPRAGLRRSGVLRFDCGAEVGEAHAERVDDPAHAADAWLAGQVAELRLATQAIYSNAIETHLRPRWGRRRLDTITVEDVAGLVRELRKEGKAEWTIAGVVKAANRTFKFAKRRMNWHGQNPVLELEKSERPKVSAAARRPIFVGDQLAQTLAAAREPFKTLFAVGSVTGARLSECLGLVWADVSLDDLDAAEIRFEYQVDRPRAPTAAQDR